MMDLPGMNPVEDVHIAEAIRTAGGEKHIPKIQALLGCSQAVCDCEASAVYLQGKCAGNNAQTEQATCTESVIHTVLLACSATKSSFLFSCHVRDHLRHSSSTHTGFRPDEASDESTAIRTPSSCLCQQSLYTLGGQLPK